MAIEFSAILSVEAALAAVENDGCALQYVRDQTPEIALRAVERNGYALQYVLDLKLFLKIAAALKISIDAPESADAA